MQLGFQMLYFYVKTNNDNKNVYCGCNVAMLHDFDNENTTFYAA